MREEAPSGDSERHPRDSAGPDAAPEPSVDSIQAQLARILASKGFAHAERLSRFLRFTVEETIQRRGDRLKEYLLGVEVFGRKDSFDPRVDTVVRVEAHRLRSKLKAYYETAGRDDPVWIDFPRGTYAPVFRKREPAAPPVAPLRLPVRLPQAWKTVLWVLALLLVGAAAYWVASSPRGILSLREERKTGGLRQTATSPRPQFPSIAVLPFADFSPQKDQEYFCDGITDELINSLAKVEGLRVVSRTSAFALKGKQQDIRSIGERLNVGTVLEGSVRKAGRRLRITAQLVDVADGYHLWSQTYEREMKDVFAVQDEISRAIVDALKIRLTGKPLERLVRRQTENVEAHHLYLKGRYQWNKRTAEGLKKGIQYFVQAAALDPNYALAYVGLADSYALLASYEVSPSIEVMPKARQAATKALQIDDTLAEAHASLGFVKSFYDWDWLGAEQEYRRAIELSPGYATARHWYSGCLRAMGRLDGAMAEIQRAQDLDPLSVAISRDMGRTFYLQRRHDQAIEQYRKTLDLEPNFPSGYLHLGLALESKSMHKEAVAALQKARGLPGGNPLILGGLAYCYASWGKRDEALKLIEELKALSARNYVSPMPMVFAYIGLGEKDRAFEWLEKACEKRDRWLAWLKVDPLFDSLRPDPRFTRLLERVGLAGA